ncbi:exported hypothetical protein [Paraburkholderia tropica]
MKMVCCLRSSYVMLSASMLSGLSLSARSAWAAGAKPANGNAAASAVSAASAARRQRALRRLPDKEWGSESFMQSCLAWTARGSGRAAGVSRGDRATDVAEELDDPGDIVVVHAVGGRHDRQAATKFNRLFGQDHIVVHEHAEMFGIRLHLGIADARRAENARLVVQIDDRGVAVDRAAQARGRDHRLAGLERAHRRHREVAVGVVLVMNHVRGREAILRRARLVELGHRKLVGEVIRRVRERTRRGLVLVRLDRLEKPPGEACEKRHADDRDQRREPELLVHRGSVPASECAEQAAASRAS